MIRKEAVIACKTFKRPGMSYLPNLRFKTLQFYKNYGKEFSLTKVKNKTSKFVKLKLFYTFGGNFLKFLKFFF